MGSQQTFGAWVFTSNVDGQFQKAGFSGDHLHECHGSIHHLQCMNDACSGDVWSADAFVPEVDEAACRLLNALPMCPTCGGLARPNVLMFGDWGWLNTRNLPQRRREEQWLQSVMESRANVVVVELGAGTAVPSVRHFSHQLSKVVGARIVRINPREFAVPSMLDVGLAMGSLEALRAVDSACLL